MLDLEHDLKNISKDTQETPQSRSTAVSETPKEGDTATCFNTKQNL